VELKQLGGDDMKPDLEYKWTIVGTYYSKSFNKIIEIKAQRAIFPPLSDEDKYYLLCNKILRHKMLIRGEL